MSCKINIYIAYRHDRISQHWTSLDRYIKYARVMNCDVKTRFGHRNASWPMTGNITVVLLRQEFTPVYNVDKHVVIEFIPRSRLKPNHVIYDIRERETTIFSVCQFEWKIFGRRPLTPRRTYRSICFSDDIPASLVYGYLQASLHPVQRNTSHVS